MNDEHDELNDYPVLRSAAKPHSPHPPEGYFDSLPSNIMARVREDKVHPFVAQEKNKWMGLLSAGVLTAAAAVLLLLVSRFSFTMQVQDQDLLSQLSREEILHELYFSDIDAEMIAQVMNPADLKAKSQSLKRSLFDSLSPEEKSDVLDDLDPIDIYAL